MVGHMTKYPFRFRIPWRSDAPRAALPPEPRFRLPPDACPRTILPAMATPQTGLFALGRMSHAHLEFDLTPGTSAAELGPVRRSSAERLAQFGTEPA